MTVFIDGSQSEQVTLRELKIGRDIGPVATISWLLRTLKKNNGEDALLKSGATVICSTPGSVHSIPPGVSVKVDFAGLEISYPATSPLNQYTAKI